MEKAKPVLIEMDCPVCSDGKAVLSTRKRTVKFLKQPFKVLSYFYKCKACRNSFTTDQTDTITMAQAYAAYMYKHTPE